MNKKLTSYAFNQVQLLFFFFPFNVRLPSNLIYKFIQVDNDIEVLTWLPLFPETWDYNDTLSCSVYAILGIKSRFCASKHSTYILSLTAFILKTAWDPGTLPWIHSASLLGLCMYILHWSWWKPVLYSWGVVSCSAPSKPLNLKHCFNSWLSLSGSLNFCPKSTSVTNFTVLSFKIW